MARPVPADLEDALAAAPAARDRFWALPPEQKDSWVAYVERARFPGARKRRVAETVRRLAGRPRAAAAVEEAAPAVALPREDWSLWLIGLALLAGLVAFLVWLTVSTRNHDDPKATAVVVNATATVPKVTGIRYQSAQFQLKDAKLASTLTRRNAGKPKGIVISQRPVEGKSVPQGTQVVLVVSNGPSGVTMPDVVGLAAADAVRALRERKLQPTLQQADSKEAPGTVLAQQPEAGKRAKPGTKVVLQVAKGATAVSVPDVTGQTQQQAVATLQQAHLAPAVAQVASSQPKGTVLAQRPAAGEKAASGSRVRINVSKGPAQPATTTQQTTTAPATTSATTSAATTTTSTTTTTKPPASGNDYTGMRLPDAVQQIADGRQQTIVEYVTSSKPAGVVVSNAKAGSRERLQVSAGPHPHQPADLPDVTGEDAGQAQRDLKAAGFTVIQVTWPVSDSASDGVVVYETPAGPQVPAGTAIVLYVGSAGGG